MSWCNLQLNPAPNCKKLQTMQWKTKTLVNKPGQQKLHKTNELWHLKTPSCEKTHLTMANQNISNGLNSICQLTINSSTSKIKSLDKVEKHNVDKIKTNLEPVYDINKT